MPRPAGSLLLTHYCSSDQIEKNQMDGHVARMGKGEEHTGFWWVNLRERDHLGDPIVDGKIILRWIFWKWDGDMDWIELAQDRERWRKLVNAVMNLRAP